QTYLLLGAQRFTGQQSFTVVEKDEKEWLQRIDSISLAEKAAINTPARVKAWGLFPEPGKTFSYKEAENLVKSVLRSRSTFNYWWKELLRHRLVFPVGPERYDRHRPA